MPGGSSADSEEPGTIAWFLSRAQSHKERQEQQQKQQEQHHHHGHKQRQQPQQACMPHLAYRSTNRCQQLLVQELGWRLPPSLSSWQQVQQQQLARVRMRPPPHHHPGFVPHDTVSCVALQQQQHHHHHSHHNRPLDGRSSNSLAAVGYASGLLRICRVHTLQATAAAALAGAAGLPAELRQAYAADPALWEAAAASSAGVTVGAGWPPAASPAGGTTWQLDTAERLRSCCWLRVGGGGADADADTGGGSGDLVTCGPSGVVLQHFAEGRISSRSLRAKGGAKVLQPSKVVAADPQAAYQLAAATGSGLLLWDLRAANAAAAAVAAADVPVPVSHSWLLAMPGGELLLSADADGQVVLYDVRRMSSSSIINFGSSRGGRQVVATFNLRARAEDAGCYAASGLGGGLAGGLVGGGGFGAVSDFWALAVALPGGAFLDHVALNPADANLLAYARPDLQVGVFDLASNRVLQQVPLLEVVRDDVAAAAAAAAAPGPNAPPAAAQRDDSTGAPGLLQQLSPQVALPCMSGARVCWGGSGRTLYAHGLLLRGSEARSSSSSSSGSGSAVALRFVPTLAAVDFGSWAGRQQRRLAVGLHTSSGGTNSGGTNSGGGGGFVTAAAVAADGGGGEGGGGGGNDRGTGAAASSASSSWSSSSTGRMCRAGQVMHVELPASVAPTELTAMADGSGLLVGTTCGDVLWLS